MPLTSLILATLAFAATIVFIWNINRNDTDV
jgi:hypothetical protein